MLVSSFHGSVSLRAIKKKPRNQANKVCEESNELIAIFVIHSLFFKGKSPGKEVAIFCVLRKLIFAIRTDLFFLLGINFPVLRESRTRH